MEFTDREFQIIHDTEFLHTKATVVSKIYDLLSEVKVGLKEEIRNSGIDQDLEKTFSMGKISKGENYRGFPYQVLDYPATFVKHDIFAFRTMFWWGNSFSCTLHLQGKHLETYREILIGKLAQIVPEGIYIGINQSPWEYHFESDNYKLLDLDDREFINKCNFLKLSKRIDFEDWSQLPRKAAEYLCLLLDLLLHKN